MQEVRRSYEYRSNWKLSKVTIELTQHKPFGPPTGQAGGFLFLLALLPLCWRGRFKMVFSARADAPIAQAH